MNKENREYPFGKPSMSSEAKTSEKDELMRRLLEMDTTGETKGLVASSLILDDLTERSRAKDPCGQPIITDDVPYDCEAISAVMHETTGTISSVRPFTYRSPYTSPPTHTMIAPGEIELGDVYYSAKDNEYYKLCETSTGERIWIILEVNDPIAEFMDMIKDD